MRHLGLNIRNARLSVGHTQESLARAIGVGMRTVQTWEHGHALPNRRNLERMAFVLQRSPEWFYIVHDEVAA